MLEMRVFKLCHNSLTMVKQRCDIIFQDHQAEDLNNKDSAAWMKLFTEHTEYASAFHHCQGIW